MKNTDKTIPVLTKELKEFEAGLTEACRSLGHRLLADSADPASGTALVSHEKIVQRQKLMDERAACTENILNIKSSGERITELKNFYAKSKRPIKQ